MTPPPISLKTLLTGLLALVFLLLALALFWVNLGSTRDFLQQQLASHAAETASALALQLPDSQDNTTTDQRAALGSRVDALFDSGYFQHIRVHQADRGILLERHQAVQVEGVPGWFIKTLPLTAPAGQAEAMAGWQRTTVTVASHPGLAYRQLWLSARNTLVLALLFWGIAATLAALLLRRALTPLHEMEKLALKVAAGEFPHLAALPRIRELHHIGHSLNHMSSAVRRMLGEQSSLVQKLQAELYQDPHTGLANRTFFLATLNQILREHAHTCGLVLVRIDGLDHCNSRHGRESGDLLIRAIADTMRAAAAVEHQHPARIDATQFGIVLEYTDADALRHYADKLAHSIAQTVRAQHMETCCTVYAGAALADAADGACLMARADAALRDAKLSPSGNSRLVIGAAQGAGSLRDLLHQAIHDAKLHIEWQPVLSCDGQRALHVEAFARLMAADQTLLPAGAFVSLAEEANLITRLDKLIVSAARTTDRIHPAAACSVNLSTASLLDPSFIDWLTGLVTTPDKMNLELLTHRLAASSGAQQVARDLRRAGFGIVLDRFVPQAQALTCMHDIRPHWIKVESSLCRQARSDIGTRAMLKTLCDYAHELGAQVGATGIEHRDELKRLCELGFDSVQGRLFDAGSRSPE